MHLCQQFLGARKGMQGSRAAEGVHRLSLDNGFPSICQNWVGLWKFLPGGRTNTAFAFSKTSSWKDFHKSSLFHLGLCNSCSKVYKKYEALPPSWSCQGVCNKNSPISKRGIHIFIHTWILMYYWFSTYYVKKANIISSNNICSVGSLTFLSLFWPASVGNFSF